MAWPPAVLPINMTDATPQQTTHPDLHNKIAQAINDSVVELGADPSGTDASVTARLTRMDNAIIAATAIGSTVNKRGAVTATAYYDVLTVDLGVATVAAQVKVDTTLRFGFAGEGVVAGVALTRTVDNGLAGEYEPHYAHAGRWCSIPLSTSWTVPAGQNMGFKVTANVTSLGNGTSCYLTGYAAWLLTPFH